MHMTVKKNIHSLNKEFGKKKQTFVMKETLIENLCPSDFLKMEKRIWKKLITFKDNLYLDVSFKINIS